MEGGRGGRRRETETRKNIKERHSKGKERDKTNEGEAKGERGS